MITDAQAAALATVVPGAPFAAFALIGAWSLAFRAPNEAVTTRLTRLALGASWLASIVLLVDVLSGDRAQPALPTFEWFRTGDYVFRFGVLLDPLSAATLTLATTITGLIGRFASTYLHREPGFVRFYLLLLLFAAGMTSLVSSPSFEQLFIGWEVVGITSVLLVGFFHERNTPVEASLRVFTTYRFADVGLLLGGVYLHKALHHTGGTTLFSGVHPDATWPDARFGLEPHAANVVVMLFLLACLGKSALFPLGGWLGRAMEGPTPSSALFYGALSVHAGVYLMLRSAPILHDATWAPIAVAAVGAATAGFGFLVARVQTDVKSTLAFSTMTQVGLMYVWIGLGWYPLAAVHMMGHATLRVWQMLRAPSALGDAVATRAAMAGAPLHDERWLGALPAGVRRKLYALALARFQVDAAIDRWVVRPVLRLGGALQHIEHRWAAAVSGWGPEALRRLDLERAERARQDV